MDTILEFLTGEGVVGAVLAVIASVFAFVRRQQAVQRWQLGKALECVEAGVRETYEGYVRSLKLAREDGKLTDEERGEANRLALEKARAYATENGVDLLKFYAREYLPVLVDKLVAGKKLPFGSADLPELEPGQPRL